MSAVHETAGWRNFVMVKRVSGDKLSALSAGATETDLGLWKYSFTSLKTFLYNLSAWFLVATGAFVPFIRPYRMHKTDVLV